MENPRFTNPRATSASQLPRINEQRSHYGDQRVSSSVSDTAERGMTTVSTPVDETPAEVVLVTVAEPMNERTISVVAGEFEHAIAELEELSRSGEVFYQRWLIENETSLRHRASREHADKIATAARELSRLESELASASTLLSRRLSAVRSNTAAS